MPTITDVVICPLKVVLLGIRRMIWQRLLVRSDSSTIADLHHILQIAMGRTDTHLHQFRIHGKKYGIARLGGISFRDNPHQVHLTDLDLRLHECFFYDYDFGDYWQHQLRVEAILIPELNRGYPACVAGTRACPPEDLRQMVVSQIFSGSMVGPVDLEITRPEHRTVRQAEAFFSRLDHHKG